MTDENRAPAPAAAVIETSLAKLEAAKRDVEAAEGQLEALLSEILVAPRAEKTAVSRVVENALQRLRAARSSLVEAEATLAPESAPKP